MELMSGYVDDVLHGRVAVGHYERLACERQLADLQRDASGDWPWVFDVDKACRVCEFIEYLPHIKGEWARRRLNLTLEGWQVFVLVTLFGWVHRDTGGRRFLEGYLEVARKNAKSTLAAGIVLYMLAADREQGAEIYTAATTRDQARIVFDDAKRMAQRCKDLQKFFGVETYRHHVAVPKTAGILKPLHAQGETLDGLNPHLALLDELHAHKKRDVYDVLISGMGARLQSLLLSITTAGFDRSSIGFERHTYARQVLDVAIHDERFFGMIFTLDKDDDPLEEVVWRKANPNLGVSVYPAKLRAEAVKARNSQSHMNNFLTKHMNVWVNADHAWMDMRAWLDCADDTLTLERVRHLEMIGGLDLASRIDIAAYVRIFHDRHSGKYYLIPEFWLPQRALDLSSNSQYDGWARAGWLNVCDGDVTDYDLIEEAILADREALRIKELPFDPYQATQLASHMLAQRVPMIECRATVQNFSEPMKWLEALVLEGRLIHNSNPVMDWMISNVVCHRDAKDNIYPRKERNENKIDGPVAAIMALNRWLHHEGKMQDISSFLNAPLSA